MMELRLPTLEQLRTVYDADLLKAFPAAELKPLRNMEELWKWIATGPGASLTGTRSWANAFVAGPSRLGADGLSVRFPRQRNAGLEGGHPAETAGGRTGHCNFRGK